MRDKYYYINRLPEFKLSYDNILHKKVFANKYMLIPAGSKVLVWFTYDNDENISLIMYLNKYNQITNVEKIVTCFDKQLSYGTIIYGTLFKYIDQNFITCEDIYYFKGEYIKEESFKNKLEILTIIFKNYIKQKAYNKNFTILGLPYIDDNFHNILMKNKEFPYQIIGIQLYLFNDCNCLGILPNKQHNNIENTFKVKANIEQDIYSLYGKGDRTDDFYGYAGIFDYKTSIMMNKYFRIIKENSNLDLLEMSDNEDEFENINEDKFVNLKKILYMKCRYNKKFKKWQPLEPVNFGDKLLNKQQIQQLER